MIIDKLLVIDSLEKMVVLIEEYINEKYKEVFEKLIFYFFNEWKWLDKIFLEEYVVRVYLKLNLFKYLYYDEYYLLLLRISIEKFDEVELKEEELKIVKVFLELVDLDVLEIF